MVKIGVLGAGSMGTGIAQVAAQSGHTVVVVDKESAQLERAAASLDRVARRLVEKGKWSAERASEVQQHIEYSTQMTDLSDSEVVIEAVVEDIAVKKKLFAELESVVSATTVLATNTSSLSITSIAAACQSPQRVIGLHFFNPAPLMPLVEVIPSIQTATATVQTMQSLMENWKKVTVLAKDTPGFIVNRLARPFYGEALRIYEEGVADFATIDWAMTALGGFPMGPFTLMDYIGNDVNYTVTETVFAAFYYDPRYKPSFTQKRHVEAGWYGRKSGRGYYAYDSEKPRAQAREEESLGKEICNRIVVMLINEAVDAVFLNIASPEDIELAMTKGVNYPKGLLAWADEMGLDRVLRHMEELQTTYGEDRYRPSALLRKMAKEKVSFF